MKKTTFLPTILLLQALKTKGYKKARKKLVIQKNSSTFATAK